MAKLLDEQPVAVHLSREQVLPSPWPGITFGSSAKIPWRGNLSLHPTTILWRWEKLSFAESCDSFVLHTLNHTKFNQVQIHLVAGKLIYEATVREGICCAKGTVSVWFLDRNQLLLLPVIPTSSPFCSASIRTNILPARQNSSSRRRKRVFFCENALVWLAFAFSTTWSPFMCPGDVTAAFPGAAARTLKCVSARNAERFVVALIRADSVVSGY